MLTQVNISSIPKVVINLPSRQDRLRAFHFEIKNIGGVYSVSPGIIKEKPSAGIGKAHLLAMEKAFEFYDYAFVLEDDVIFPGKGKTIEHVNKCLNNIPDEWDILLGGVYNQNGITVYNEYWNRVDDFRGLHFYIITKEAYERIKANYAFEDHIDKWISENGFKVFVMNPFCAMQKDGYSDNVKFVTKYNKLYWKRFNILKP